MSRAEGIELILCAETGSLVELERSVQAVSRLLYERTVACLY